MLLITVSRNHSKTTDVAWAHTRGMVLGCACVCALTTACRRPETTHTPSGRVLAVVGEESIRESDLELLERIEPEVGRQIGVDALRAGIVENFAGRLALYQEAVATGLDSEPLVQAKIDLFRKIILAQEYLQNHVDAYCASYYAAHPEEFSEVDIAHVYVAFDATANTESLANANADAAARAGAPARNEAQARKLAETLHADLMDTPPDKRVGRFEQLVVEVSDDDDTKGAGGRFGWVRAKEPQMHRHGWLDVATAALQLDSDVAWPPLIRSSNGFHIVRIVTPRRALPYEAVSMGILKRFRGQVERDLLDQVKRKFGVNIFTAPAARPSATR